MAKQTPPATPKISASADGAPKPQNPESKAAQPSAMEVNAPLISSEVHGIVVPSAMKGSYLTVDPRMDGSDITVTFSAKEAPELVLENLVDSSGETGAREIEIPLSYLTRLMGFTALFSYTGRSQGQLAASLVKEVGISFYPASESEALAPRLLHEKILHNTPTYDMKDHEGNETVIVPLHPLAKAGDKVYCTAVTEQDVPPHEFYTVIYDHRLTEEEVASGDALRPEIARGWLSRRKPWRSITLQSAWITSGLPAEPPADIDPHLETRLPRNALEVQRRRTAALIVAPGLDLPPPHLRQSVQYNDEWCLNPENTREGGEVIIPGLDAYKGDEVKFYVSGPGYAKKLLGHVTLEQDGDLPCIKLSACVVACFFTQAMTLSYTLGFNDNEQSSPVRVINVLTPTFPPAQIEEATKTILSLTTFKGDATARVPVPAYSVCSSYCWMWFVGKYEDGRAYRFDILERATMTDAWKAQGVIAPIPRAALQELADCSTFELHFALSFCEKDTFESAHAFPVQTFTIEQEPLELLAPTVTEAVGNELTVWNGRDGVHVEASYLGNHPTHTLSLCWTQPNGTCWPLESQPGSASGTTTFLVPREAVIESIGKTVKINYTVTSACKVQTSKDLNLHISVPVRLPTPVVEQATPRATQYGILDLATFPADALITVEPWWFALAGQCVWLKCTGIKKDGTEHTFYVVKGRPLTPEEAQAGLSQTLSRSDLLLLKHDSPLTVTCMAAPDSNEPERSSITFPVLNLIVKRQLICQVERFEGLALGMFAAGGSIQTDLMKITFTSGAGLAGIGTYGNDSYYSGKHFVMCQNSDHQIPPQLHRFDFSRELESVRFSWAWKQRPATVTFYDPAGNMVRQETYPDDWRGGFWVELVTSPGTTVAWMTILVEDYSFIDNFSMCYRV
ncbi:hypothetical protein [Pseudomonas sp. W4I3]|uniref:hypothetical protein n=1 Tax=Pseudomonas sp. W4I3 TaxID=3042294 RepID=UPI00277D3645|nr:hypothetical protein [Pseudomonas sp. W4I3]MDQ0741504.1 hypothetical protein [Pseudomonas sp. W4I3]